MRCTSLSSPPASLPVLGVPCTAQWLGMRITLILHCAMHGGAHNPNTALRNERGCAQPQHCISQPTGKRTNPALLHAPLLLPLALAEPSSPGSSLHCAILPTEARAPIAAACAAAPSSRSRSLPVLEVPCIAQDLEAHITIWLLLVLLLLPFLAPTAPSIPEDTLHLTAVTGAHNPTAAVCAAASLPCAR